jgi:autotransporter-associated beta strand protein
MKPRILSTGRLSFTFTSAIAALLAASASKVEAQLYYKSTTASNTWDGSFWGTDPSGPFTGAWVSGSDVVFVDNGGTTLLLTGATTNFSSITANESVTVTPSGTLGTGGTVANITVAAGKTLSFGTQAISTAAGTGFIKDGEGILGLAGGNYSGGFTLNAGIVQVSGVNAMGSGGTLTINGGTIRPNDANARDLSGKYAGGIFINGNFALSTSATSGLLTFTDTMNLGSSNRIITVNGPVNFGGVISGGSGVGFTKAGTGTLTLNGSAVNTFTGGLNVTGGTLALDYANLATPTNLINSASALQLNNGILTITGKNVAAATTSQTFASTTLGAGRNTVNIAKGASATSATLNLGPLTVNSGSATIFSPTTAWTTTASTTEIVKISAGGVGTVPIPSSGTEFVNAGVFHRVAGGAAGTLRLAAVNSSGQLLLKANAGNLATSTGIDPTGSYQYAAGAGGIALSGNASVYGLLLNATNNPSTLTIANGGTLTLNSIIQIKASEVVNITPGTGVSNLVIGSERNLVIAMDNTAGVGISAPIVDNGGGASAVTIVGTTAAFGGVTFSGNNTYSGVTTLDGSAATAARSIFTVAHNNAFGSTAAGTVLIGGSTAGNGVSMTLNNGITVTGEELTIKSAGVRTSILTTNGGTAAWHGNVIIDPNPGAFIQLQAVGTSGSLTFGASASDTFTLNGGVSFRGTGLATVNSTISGSGGNLQKLDAGTLVLTAANTHTSNTNVAGGATGGVIRLANSLALQNSTLDILTTGSVSALTFDSSVVSNTFALGGLSAIATGDAKNIALQNTAATAIALSVGKNDQSTTYNGIMSGGGSLTKIGTGTLTLGGANSYTGATSVDKGTLTLSATGSVATSASVKVASGATLDVSAQSGGWTVGGAANAQKLTGSGNVTGATIIAGTANNGTHNAGDATVGKQTFSSSLTYNSGSIFEWDLNANAETGRGTNYDAVDATTLTVNSGAIFKVVLGSGVTADPFWTNPAVTRTWSDIFSFTTLVGSFNTADIVVTGPGAPNTGMGSFSISGTSLTWTAVPEPSTALVGLLIGAGLLRRRRNVGC